MHLVIYSTLKEWKTKYLSYILIANVTNLIATSSQYLFYTSLVYLLTILTIIGNNR
jgi:hypothetical protein